MENLWVIAVAASEGGGKAAEAPAQTGFVEMNGFDRSGDELTYQMPYAFLYAFGRIRTTNVLLNSGASFETDELVVAEHRREFADVIEHGTTQERQRLTVGR